MTASEEIMLYFADENSLYLVPVTRSVEAGKALNPEERAKMVLHELIKGPSRGSRLVPTVSHMTDVKNIEVENGVATIDFSEELVGYGGGTSQELILVNSIVYTLTELPEIDRLQFVIDSRVESYLPEGYIIEKPVSRGKWINCVDLYGPNETQSSGTMTILYVPTIAGKYLVPISVPLVSNLPEGILKALQDIRDFPRSDVYQLRSPIPMTTVYNEFEEPEIKSTDVYAVDLGADGVISVDFNDTFTNGMGNVLSPRMIIDSLLLSLTSPPNITDVYILVNGEAIKNFRGIDLKQPLGRPRYYNREESLQFEIFDLYIYKMASENEIKDKVLEIFAGEPSNVVGWQSQAVSAVLGDLAGVEITLTIIASLASVGYMVEKIRELVKWLKRRGGKLRIPLAVAEAIARTDLEFVKNVTDYELIKAEMFPEESDELEVIFVSELLDCFAFVFKNKKTGRRHRYILNNEGDIRRYEVLE